MDDTIQTLLVKTRNVLPTPCRETFDQALKLGFTNLTAVDLFKSPSLAKKLLVLEEALNTTSRSCIELEHTHIDILLFVVPHLFRALRTVTSQPLIPSTSTANKILPNQKELKNDVNLKANRSNPVSEPKKIVVTPKPSGDDLEAVYQSVTKFVDNGFRTKFHKSLDCRIKSCLFCKNMYSYVNLTACNSMHTNTKPCVPTGWYPHVGIGLWKCIKPAHDKGKPYRADVKPVKTQELPPLIMWQTNLANSLEPSQIAEIPIPIANTGTNIQPMEEDLTLHASVSDLSLIEETWNEALETELPLKKLKSEAPSLAVYKHKTQKSKGPYRKGSTPPPKSK